MNVNGMVSFLESANFGPLETRNSIETFDLVRKECQRMRMEFWINALLSNQSRERALSVLAEDNGIKQGLGSILGGSPTIMHIIFQEVFAAYSQLRSPVLLDMICERASDALILLKYVASHPSTRLLLLDAQITQCMMAFLEMNDCTRPYELLRFNCLGVISALVQDEDEEIVKYLLKNKLFPRILSCMERGFEFTKTVAAFIVFRIIIHESGMKYLCTIPDRFSAISHTLSVTVYEFGFEPHPLLLSCVVGCYFRLSKHPRARAGLTIWLPKKLQTYAWTAIFNDDLETYQWAQQLRINVANGHYNHLVML